MPAQGPPQLPPQMFTTAAQLLDLTDSTFIHVHISYLPLHLSSSGVSVDLLFPPAEKLVLVLRDGRKLIGVLRSWDQFGMHTLPRWF